MKQNIQNNSACNLTHIRFNCITQGLQNIDWIPTYTPVPKPHLLNKRIDEPSQRLPKESRLT